MTNRELAKHWFSMSPTPEVEDYVHGLDAAERRGWIAALEWCDENLEFVARRGDFTLADKLAERKTQGRERPPVRPADPKGK